MIKKHPIQFDSGGILLEHVFLLPFLTAEKIETEEDVDRFIEEAIVDFNYALKFYLMMKLGYEGMEDEKWVKKIENG